jgi:tetratricopeptide (TPR) repeat protein
VFSANIGMIYYDARRYDEAIAQLQATLDIDSSFDYARSFLGRTYLRMGHADKAVEEFQRRRSTTYGSTADIAAAHALAGRRDEALAELRCLLDAAQVRYVSGYDVATVYAALGETTAARLARARHGDHVCRSRSRRRRDSHSSTLSTDRETAPDATASAIRAQEPAAP